MYPQLNFASVCKRDMRKDGKLLSFKAKTYRSEMLGRRDNILGARDLSGRFWTLFFFVAWELRPVKRPEWC